MKIAVLTYGTRGDVQPYAVLGDYWASRGHDVRVSVCTNLVEMVEQAGLSAVPIPIDSYEFFASEEGRAILAAGDTRRFLAELGERERQESSGFDDALLETCRGADVVVASVLTVARAMSVVEATGQQLVPVFTLPVTPTGDYASPYLVPGRRVPGRAVRRLTHLGFEAVYGRLQRDNLAALRRRLELPARTASPLRALRRSGRNTYHLVSPEILPRPIDWPASARLIGAPLVPGRLREAWGELGVSAELDAWLTAGPAPVFFGFGSMPVLDPASTLAMVEQVSAALGVRALVGAGWSGVATGSYGETTYVVADVDHDAVLPRCRAAVHHGGSGTTQSVLRAGLPAVVAHVFADQSLWGECLERAGLGASLAYRDLDADSLQAALAPLLAEPVRERAGAAAGRIDRDRPLDDLTEALDNL